MLTKEEVLEKLYNSKKTFIKILVRLGILKYKRALFGSYPKTITFVGALGYRKNDPNVSLWTEGDDGPCSTKVLYFDFDQIVGIRKIKS